MKVFGRRITDDDMVVIKGLMNEEIMNAVLEEAGDCSNEEFIELYLMHDPIFEVILKIEMKFEGGE